MKPQSPASALMIHKLALFSVRAERAAEQEFARIAMNVRHAEDDFDEQRIERAEALFAALSEVPRANFRKLRKSPEGVDRLIDEWQDLRADLAIHPEPTWTAAHVERVAYLLGVEPEHARGSRLGALSMGAWGDFSLLGQEDGGALGDAARRAWCRGRLSERIDAEVAALESHCETLDYETIARDRAEAGLRARFDPGKEASLARRYESEANRGFFKALQEYRRVEAESAALSEASAPPATPEPPPARVGSSREMTPMVAREPSRAIPDPDSTWHDADEGPGANHPTRFRPAPTPG